MIACAKPFLPSNVARDFFLRQIGKKKRMWKRKNRSVDREKALGRAELGAGGFQRSGQTAAAREAGP